MAKVKSLKVNMVLNGIKGCLSVIFPLITLPYVSRVLGVEEIGKYNFSVSVVSYFALLAGLGINTYAIREGARIRDDEKAVSDFASEMYTINFTSTVVSYLALILLVLAVPRFHEVKYVIFILSIQIILTTFGVEWIYSIFEDYLFITLRTIIIQLISLALIFLIVRSQNDINKYALVSVVACAGTNVFNRIHSKNYCKVKLKPGVEWKKHIKPILILFAMQATITIYVSSDTTMLGFINGNHEVGIYSISTKIYNVVNQIMASVITVSIPRISALVGKGEREAVNKTASDVYSIIWTIALPAMMGLILLRRQIILTISTPDFIAATSSLTILSFALLMCLGAYFWGQAVLLPMRREKTVFHITVFSACLNVGLNFILLPKWGQNAAAFTTLLSEGSSFLLCYLNGRKEVKLQGVVSDFIKTCIGCVVMLAVDVPLMKYISSLSKYAVLLIVFAVSVIVYFAVEIALKNSSLKGLKRLIRK